MVPKWSEAELLVERDGVRIAVWRDGDGHVVAEGPAASNAPGPEAWGSGGGFTTQVCGTLAWAAGGGEPPVPVRAGRSWTLARAAGGWILSGLAAEAPPEWEVGGTRWPVRFGPG